MIFAKKLRKEFHTVRLHHRKDTKAKRAILNTAKKSQDKTRLDPRHKDSKVDNLDCNRRRGSLHNLDVELGYYASRGIEKQSSPQRPGLKLNSVELSSLSG